MAGMILAGTRKGLFVLRDGGDRRSWSVEEPVLDGWETPRSFRARPRLAVVGRAVDGRAVDGVVAGGIDGAVARILHRVVDLPPVEHRLLDRPGAAVSVVAEDEEPLAGACEDHPGHRVATYRFGRGDDLRRRAPRRPPERAGDARPRVRAELVNRLAGDRAAAHRGGQLRPGRPRAADGGRRGGCGGDRAARRHRIRGPRPQPQGLRARCARPRSTGSTSPSPRPSPSTGGTATCRSTRRWSRRRRSSTPPSGRRR